MLLGIGIVLFVMGLFLLGASYAESDGFVAGYREAFVWAVIVGVVLIGTGYIKRQFKTARG